MHGIDTLFNNKALRKGLLKLRLPLGIAVAIAVVLNTKQQWFWQGLAVSMFGALAQLWCFANIKTQKELAATGPYMLVRNPMYLARFFLILGILLWTANPWVIGLYVVAYYFYMVNRVRREERKLRTVFGEPYERYCTDVNRFIPSLSSRFRAADLFAADRECFQRNNGLNNIIAVLAFYAAAYLWVFVLR